MTQDVIVKGKLLSSLCLQSIIIPLNDCFLGFICFCDVVVENSHAYGTIFDDFEDNKENSKSDVINMAWLT